MTLEHPRIIWYTLNFNRYDITKAKVLLEAIIIFTIPEVHKYTCSKWPKSTWQPSSIHFRHGTSLLRLHGHLEPVYASTSGK
jgi:hypothetical protein